MAVLSLPHYAGAPRRRSWWTCSCSVRHSGRARHHLRRALVDGARAIALTAAGRMERAAAPGLTHGAIGFITNFFDTLGIGSFATTTTIYKLRQLVPDERIPGTMLVGHTLPVAAQAFAFISVVSVDPRQLVLLIIAMMAGGWLGAGTVSRLPRRVIQVGMAAALLLAGLFMTMGLLQLYPAGGDALSLTPPRLDRGAGGQLRPGRARDARDRQLWTEPGPLESPRHGAPRGVSDHDGFGSVHGHGRGDAVREQRTLVRPGCAGARARRHSRRVDCRLAGAVVTSRHRPLGRDRRGALHGHDADTFGGRGTADARRRACGCPPRRLICGCALCASSAHLVPARAKTLSDLRGSPQSPMTRD